MPDSLGYLIGNYKTILYGIDQYSKVFDNVRFHYNFLVGTKYFAVIALKAGRHRMAILAMITLGISAICVSPESISHFLLSILFNNTAVVSC